LDKKQDLKAAAHDIFSKTGYKATGISEIAKQAGVAVGSFSNNRVRQAMINEIDLGMDMVELVSQIFRTSRSYISSNKILSEWYNPMISNELHRYYSSEEGKISNSFHQFLEETFTNRIEDEGYSQERIQEILQVYNLFYYMDMHITENDFPGVSKTVEILATYFVKGILKK